MIFIILFITALFIRPQDWPGTPFFNIPMYYIVVLGGLAYGVIRGSKYFKLGLTQNIFVVLFVALAYISNSTNGYMDAANQQFITLFKRMLTYFMLLLLLNNEKKIKQTIFLGVVAGIILVFQGIYQDLYGIGWARQALHGTTMITEQSALYCYEEFGTRTFWIGDWDGPNVLALVYLFGIPFCLEGFFKKGQKTPKRIFYGSVFAFLSYGIFLTNSRGGFLALSIMAGTYIVLRFGLKRIPMLIIIGLPLLLLFAPARMKQLNTDEASAHERTWLWEQGINLALERPLFGAGRGQFYRHAGLVAHNNFVGSLAETGAIGLFVYVSLVYMTLKGTYLVYQKCRNDSIEPELMSVARIVFLISCGFYVATFFVLMELELLYFIWALSGSVIMIGMKRLDDFEIKYKWQDYFNVIVVGVAITGTIWFIASH